MGLRRYQGRLMSPKSASKVGTWRAIGACPWPSIFQGKLQPGCPVVFLVYNPSFLGVVWFLWRRAVHEGELALTVLWMACVFGFIAGSQASYLR
jgi:hypothetical protein